MNEGRVERERERERERVGICRSTGRITFIFFIAFIIALNIITGMMVVHKLLISSQQGFIFTDMM